MTLEIPKAVLDAWHSQTWLLMGRGEAIRDNQCRCPITAAAEIITGDPHANGAWVTAGKVVGMDRSLASRVAYSSDNADGPHRAELLELLGKVELGWGSP
jgi:hypothetical protein